MIRKREDIWKGTVNYYEKFADYVQVVKVKGNAVTSLSGKVEFMVVNAKSALPPAGVDFSVSFGK
ncbi:MAG: hypothetical protein Q8941_24340 [Bacteroidota bacterium]|nr:hypothetical protein [Bacteroidota bacterium]